MEISISKRTNNHYKEDPAIGEIVVQIKGPPKKIKILNIDENKLENLLEEYVDKAENFGDYDIELEQEILSLGINEQEFIEMKIDLERQNTNEYAVDVTNGEYPEFTGFINFPWKKWKERLLKIYE